MPATKATGTRALALVREERAALDRREKLHRQEAAIELGEVALAAGVEAFSSADLKTILVAARDLGPKRAIELLKAGTGTPLPGKSNGIHREPGGEATGNAGA